MVGFIKCNVDGSAKGNSGHAATASIFLSSREDFVGAFSIYNEISRVLDSEIMVK